MLVLEKLFFFNCYLAVPRPTLGYSRGDSLSMFINSMLMESFIFCAVIYALSNENNCSDTIGYDISEVGI